MKVHTTKGNIEFSELDVLDIVEMQETARVTSTEWRLKGTDEVVRRDVNVSLLRGLEMGAEQGAI